MDLEALDSPEQVGEEEEIASKIVEEARPDIPKEQSSLRVLSELALQEESLVQENSLSQLWSLTKILRRAGLRTS